MTDMISFGGGINSTAMTILLVNEGWRGPIVFADTGGEWPETYCYMDYFEESFLRPHDLEIARIKPPSKYHRPQITQASLEKYSLETGYLPMAYIRWCTHQFKIEPLRKWQNEHSIDVHYVGFSAEESHRAKRAKKQRLGIAEWPLLERWIDRDGCKEIIKTEGFEVPPKSSCFFCPFQSRHRWRDLWTFHPELYERAAEMERVAEKRRTVKYATLDPAGRWSLDQLGERIQSQRELPGFEYEYLREFQGCICGL